MLLYSGLSGTRQAVNPLLQLAATRGRLMELLLERVAEAGPGGREGADQAYMVGILSLMPALFGSSMSDVLGQLPVARPVHDALADHGGTLGDLLRLVKSLEGSAGNSPRRSPGQDSAAVLRRLPGIDANYANSSLSAALSWANNLARESS